MQFLAPTAGVEVMDLRCLTYGFDRIRVNCVQGDYLENLIPLTIDIDTPDDGPHALSQALPFPPELTSAILENLPIRDLMSFRLCSHSTLYFVKSMPMFSSILSLAPQVLRGILAIRTTAPITLPQLYASLCQRHCENCGRPAQFIWLATGLRICYIDGRCQHPKGDRFPLVPLPKEDLFELYGLEETDLARIPSYACLPATFYNRNSEVSFGGNHILYDTTTAARIAFQRYGTWHAPMKDVEPSVFETNNRREDQERRSEEYIAKTKRRENGPHSWGYRRLAVCLVAAWIMPGKLETEEGLFCTMCALTQGSSNLYTPETTREHLQSCRVKPFDERHVRARDEAEQQFPQLR